MKHNIDGQSAEQAVIKLLDKSGYKVLDHNWKTPKCEIDIVAKKDKCIYFVEVKFRTNPDQGEGFDYITPGKLRQMSYAAVVWVAQNKWDGEYCLSAASVSGEDFKIDFIEQV